MTDVVHVTNKGFGRLEAVVEGLDTYKGHKIKILAKNEIFVVRYMMKEGVGGAVMACAPDLICMVNLNTGNLIKGAYLLATTVTKPIHHKRDTNFVAFCNLPGITPASTGRGQRIGELACICFPLQYFIQACIYGARIQTHDYLILCFCLCIQGLKFLMSQKPTYRFSALNATFSSLQ